MKHDNENEPQLYISNLVEPTPSSSLQFFPPGEFKISKAFRV